MSLSGAVKSPATSTTSTPRPAISVTTDRRRDLGNPTNLPDPSFNGWYLQTSWILTGEAKKYNPSTGSFTAPKPNDPFVLDKAGIGAWEVVARYSDLDLNYHAGVAGHADAGGRHPRRRPAHLVGGYQLVPEPGDPLHAGLSACGCFAPVSAGYRRDARKLDDVSLRTQISF